MSSSIEVPKSIDRHEIKFDLRHIDSQDLDSDGDGEAMSSTTSFGRKWRLLRLIIHFSAACSQTLTISFNSRDGANYDTVISVQVLAGVTNIYVQGEETDIFWIGDEITVAITAGSGAPTAYLTILGEQVS
ncbi:MAG: hypothetical protein ACXADY_20760 [Candidatus Hodarchaeales archaeon]|jgi:hypothetical protein